MEQKLFFTPNNKQCVMLFLIYTAGQIHKNYHCLRIADVKASIKLLKFLALMIHNLRYMP